MRVRRHDAFGADARIVLQVRAHAVDPAFDVLDWKLCSDHTSLTHQDLIGSRFELRRGRRGHAPRILDTALTCRHVAAFTIGDNRAKSSELDRLSADDDGCARKMIAR